jgi:hypothetical protein
MPLGRAHSPDVKMWETASLEEHVSLIAKQLHKSMRDPQLRQLAVKIVSGKADDHVYDRRTEEEVPVAIAWGEAFRLPQIKVCDMNDATCESQALWDFYVMNVRYVLDPEGFDLFATAKYTLLAGGADCDDAVITLGALHQLIGFQNLQARVVSTNGRYWEHIYLMVGFPKVGKPKKWVPLDPTIAGAVPGWQYNKIKAYQDFQL